MVATNDRYHLENVKPLGFGYVEILADECGATATACLRVTESVMVHRKGNAVILEPVREWPDNYVDSFSGVPEDFERPAQGEAERRRKL